MKYRPKKSHLEAITAAFLIYNNVVTTREKWTQWKLGRGFTVSVLSTDPAHEAVGKAILEILPATHQKRIQVASKRKDSGDLSVFEGYIATKPQVVKIEGYDVKIDLEQAENLTNSSSGPGRIDMESMLASLKPDKLRFTTATYEGKQAVVRFIQHAVKTEQNRAPRLKAATRWGGWTTVAEVQPRSLETVVLQGDIVEELVDDVKHFLSQEEEYAARGLPWHRGYLLHGPPGTGKTSLVRAVASEIGLDLYAMSLSNIRDDQTMDQLFQEVQPRSALLVEDIDRTGAAQGVAKKEGVSTSGLLNCLDGIATPHGLVTFMSANKRERLEKALIRPGRVDREFELSYLTDKQLEKMVHVFTGTDPFLPKVPAKVPPALVIELYKETLHQPEMFIPLLEERFATINRKKAKT